MNSIIQIELMDAPQLQRLILSLSERVDELRQQLDAKQTELDTVIAAHKQQVQELTDALSPVEWEPGRVPTEEGMYWWRKENERLCMIRVFGRDGLLFVDAGGWSVQDLARRYPTGRWLGPAVLPRPRCS